jgi:hypothetical protein
MAQKGSISTTMQHVPTHDISEKADRDDVYDQNPNPYFNKPHARGPDTIPVVMKEGINGETFDFSTEEINRRAAISSTMGSSVSKKS